MNKEVSQESIKKELIFHHYLINQQQQDHKLLIRKLKEIGQLDHALKIENQCL